jgi:hypothetical protein
MAKKIKYTKRNTKRNTKRRYKRKVRKTSRANQRGGATLKEFKDRYRETHAQALAGIKVGKKIGCWSWWIWPVSTRDLNSKSRENRVKYALTDNEARDFLADGYLRNKWLEIMTAVYTQLNDREINYRILATGTNKIDDSWCLVATCKLFQRITAGGSDPAVNKVCTDILAKIEEQKAGHRRRSREEQFEQQDRRAGKKGAAELELEKQTRDNEKILISMGFSQELASDALVRMRGNIEEAINLLIGPGAPGAPVFPTGGATGQPSHHRAPRQPCRYGTRCTRKNPDHKKQYSHPEDSDWPGGGAPGPRPGSHHRAPRQPCRYGHECTVTGGAHAEQYSHPSHPSHPKPGPGGGAPGGGAPPPRLAGGPDPMAAKAGGNQVIVKRGSFSQAIAYEESMLGYRTGILIAGNAGLPGGALGKKNGWFGSKILDGSGTFWSEPRYYSTQEESVVNSWFHGTQLRGHDVQEVFRHNIGDGDKGLGPDGRPWGLRYTDEPLSGNRDKSTTTLQGHNYTESFSLAEPKYHIIKYDFCHPVLNQLITHYRDYESFSGPELFETSLYFTFGPNVAKTGTDKNLGTMARTLVSGYNHDNPLHYDIFRGCVKQSFKTSLETMNDNGIQVPILCRVSGGIYSGKPNPGMPEGTPTYIRINDEYEAIINEIIKENPEDLYADEFNFNKIILCL